MPKMTSLTALQNLTLNFKKRPFDNVSLATLQNFGYELEKFTQTLDAQILY